MRFCFRVLLSFVILMGGFFYSDITNAALCNDGNGTLYPCDENQPVTGDSQPTTNPSSSTPSSSTPASTGGGGGGTTVIVTEMLPGMQQYCSSAGTIDAPKFKCTIPGGFMGVMFLLKGLIKYATFLVAIIGVFMLVVSGIQYSIAGASHDAQKHSTERIQKVIMGLTLLFMVGFILNTVAPWIYG